MEACSSGLGQGQHLVSAQCRWFADCHVMMQAKNDTVTVVEEVPLDPKRERMKHRNPRDTSWQQCAHLSMLLLRTGHAPLQLGTRGRAAGAEALAAA